MAQGKPAHTTHQVAKGETLYSISKKYHVTVESLEKANKSLGENFKLKIGQKISIPSTSLVKATETKSEKKGVTSKPEKPLPSASTIHSARPAAKETNTNEPKPANTSINSDPTTHIVTKGETVYAIAKANGLTWRQIKDANHLSDDMKLKLGQKLIIPSKNKEAMYDPAAREVSVPSKSDKPIANTTEQGKDYLSAEPPVIKKPASKPQETIPQIRATAPRSEPTPAKTQKKPEPTGDENPFLPKSKSNNAVSTSSSLPPAPVETIINDNVAPSEYANTFNKYAESGKKKMVYRGICTFMQNDNPGNQYLALYNYAEMGAILKVTNLMSKEAIYVKVVGKVPANDTQKDVILKVSADAASTLKVNEEKFIVEVTGFNIQ